MKLRTIAVIALALVAGGAQAQDAGWDSKMGFVFGIGVDGDPMGEYDGKIGLQYNLGPQAAVRLGLAIGRDSCGDVENDDSTTNVVTTSPCAKPGVLIDYNSQLAIGLSAEYLMRSTTAAVSPYFGGGVFVDFLSESLKGQTEQDPAPVGVTFTEYNDKASSFGFGLLGKAGVEWRVNKVIALFAEYQLTVTAIRSNKVVLDEQNGATVIADETTKNKDVFGVSTSVSNGGLVGITAFF